MFGDSTHQHFGDGKDDEDVDSETDPAEEWALNRREQVAEAMDQHLGLTNTADSKTAAQTSPSHSHRPASEPPKPKEQDDQSTGPTRVKLIMPSHRSWNTPNTPLVATPIRRTIRRPTTPAVETVNEEAADILTPGRVTIEHAPNDTAEPNQPSSNEDNDERPPLVPLPSSHHEDKEPTP